MKNQQYLCPICGIILSISSGGRNRKDGYTIFCNNDKCTSNETPTAFGRNENTAYNTLVYKYGLKNKKELIIEEKEEDFNTDNSNPEISKDSKISYD